MLNNSSIFSNNEEYSNKFIDSLNLKLGYGLFFTEDDYNKYILGQEKRVPHVYLHDYICVVKNGTLNWLHYGPSGLNEIRPSTFELNDNLSFCEGVYCYNSEVHVPDYVFKKTPFNHKTSNGLSIYFGEYSGDYVECVYDCDPRDEANNKGEGRLREYVLLVDAPVKFDKEVVCREI